MIISTLYQCDVCQKKTRGRSRNLPRGWKWLPIKGYLCSACARLDGQHVQNLSKKELRGELERRGLC